MLCELVMHRGKPPMAIENEIIENEVIENEIENTELEENEIEVNEDEEFEIEEENEIENEEFEAENEVSENEEFEIENEEFEMENEDNFDTETERKLIPTFANSDSHRVFNVLVKKKTTLNDDQKQKISQYISLAEELADPNSDKRAGNVFIIAMLLEEAGFRAKKYAKDGGRKFGGDNRGNGGRGGNDRGFRRDGRGDRNDRGPRRDDGGFRRRDSQERDGRGDRNDRPRRDFGENSFGNQNRSEGYSSFEGRRPFSREERPNRENRFPREDNFDRENNFRRQDRNDRGNRSFDRGYGDRNSSRNSFANSGERLGFNQRHRGDDDVFHANDEVRFDRNSFARQNNRNNDFEEFVRHEREVRVYSPNQDRGQERSNSFGRQRDEREPRRDGRQHGRNEFQNRQFGKPFANDFDRSENGERERRPFNRDRRPSSGDRMSERGFERRGRRDKPFKKFDDEAFMRPLRSNKRSPKANGENDNTNEDFSQRPAFGKKKGFKKFSDTPDRGRKSVMRKSKHRASDEGR